MKSISFTALLALVMLTRPLAAQEKVTLSGYVKDASNGEELIGVTIYVDQLQNGVVTNSYGFYSLTLAPGSYDVSFSYVGYETISKSIKLTAKKELNIQLQDATTQMQEIVISAESAEEDLNVQRIEMSKNDIDVGLVKKTPALFGEPDILKTVQMMPGVISAGEGTSSYFVRGGGADQNLILIDEAPIYDPSHFFGLFSVFNADVIKDSELYKGGIPSQFGGRLSSILDVRTIDGNNQNFSGSATIGTLASKVLLEGPIQQDKASFLLSARRSYADVFLQFSPNEDARNNQVYFYDINAKVNWKPNNNNRFFLAAYVGRDAFNLDDQFGFNWGNKTTTFRWNHLFNERLFSNTTLIASNFDYQLNSQSTASEFNWTADLQEFSVKEDITFFASPKNTVSMGVHASFRQFSPGNIKPGSETSIFVSNEFDKSYAFDYALYAGNEQQITERLSLLYGLRLSLFQNVGEATIYEYAKNEQGLPDNVNISILDSATYGPLEPVETFFNLEPRFSARYLLTDESSIKASYHRMAQYIHLLSNSTLPVPFNTWTPSSPYLKPQLADQLALGYFKNFQDNSYEFSVEGYYKELHDVTEFADNANLLLNENAPAEYRQGEGTSYGVEVYVQKKKGALTGFGSYTWSKTRLDIPGVNNSLPFFANYDRRHVTNWVANYAFSNQWSFGANFTYSTGRPFTLPVGRYTYDGYNVDLYSGRNSYRLPAYHRLDFSANFEPRKNETRRMKQSWSFSIYNVYNRKNAFTIYTRAAQNDDGVVTDPNRKEARMVYLFPILPSVSWKLTF
uniref:TonB-dependent receptor n=1 Tax=Roseihalotalea indica TaxID=2867963 RepID=A0AA49GMH0_9BACT|nr:TonB-dependent receptor [Tunicatimonas sp. TK19036]